MFRTDGFKGSYVADRSGRRFGANDFGAWVGNIWSGTTPMGAEDSVTDTAKPGSITPVITNNLTLIQRLTNFKTSFDPISDTDTKVLILDTIPGGKSLELGEYYARTGDKFWKVIATITGKEFPKSYTEKKQLLLDSKIGVWYVVHKARRKGSPDTGIRNEVPNDLDSFMARHKKLKLIGFNGVRAAALFDTYLKRERGTKYVLLPGTSPANTNCDFDTMCRIWKNVLESPFGNFPG